VAPEGLTYVFSLHLPTSPAPQFFFGISLSHVLPGNLHAKDVKNLMPGVHFLPFPYSYRCPMGLGGEQGTKTILNYIENLLDDPESGILKPAGNIFAIFLSFISWVFFWRAPGSLLLFLGFLFFYKAVLGCFLFRAIRRAEV
jgi:hypothetical protein